MTTFDLHMHSYYSADGQFSPSELIELIQKAKLTTVALSDHNSPQGIDEMLKLGKEKGIKVIPAIEFDTLFDGLEVHVLGYNLDYTLPYFQTLAKTLNVGKADSLRNRVAKVNAYYHMDLDIDHILAIHGNKHPWQSIIKAMLEDPRYANKPEFQPYQPGGSRSEPAAVNFYWDNCSVGTPCYELVEYPSLEDTVKIIHDAGGIAVLAHPWKNFYQHEDRIQKAISQGIDGIEAYSNYHEAIHNTYYDNYCKEHNILLTCGSDFHGETKPSIHLGEYGYTKNDTELLLTKFLDNINKFK